MTKPVFKCFDEAHFKRTGESYQAGVFEDDYVAEYPYTDVPIPVELQALDKVPFFNSQTRQWEDHSEDAEIQLAKKQADDLAAAKQDAADAKATVTSLTEQLTEAQDAIVELAQATLPSTDTATETTETEAK